MRISQHMHLKLAATFRYSVHTQYHVTNITSVFAAITVMMLRDDHDKWLL